MSPLSQPEKALLLSEIDEQIESLYNELLQIARDADRSAIGFEEEGKRANACLTKIEDLNLKRELLAKEEETDEDG